MHETGPEAGEDHLSSRREKLHRLRQRGVDPYPPSYQRTSTAAEAAALFLSAEGDQDAPVRAGPVSVAGRIMSMRGMGRATFLDLRDGSSRIQVHLRRDVLGEEYELARDLDMGDILGVSGPLFRTRTGEITVEAQALTLLAKSMRPLPEKWHGLRDIEVRYRQRYVDLISNPEVGEVFLLRSRIIGAVRSFLNGRGFVEVDTPILVPIPAGAMARPFSTHHHSLDRELYLRIATELYLKRLIVGGFDKVYELGRVFRNEGMDQNHNPEFTTLETYEAYADYSDVMAMVEEMVSAVAMEVLGSMEVHYKDHDLDFTPPWRRVTFRDAILQYGGIDVDPYVRGLSPMAHLEDEARGKGLVLGEAASFKVLDKLFSLTVEPHLVQPTFVLDYPKDTAPLAKGKRDDPALVERFEAFAGGMEFANAYTELNDPEEQMGRLAAQEEWRRTLGEEEAERTDADFLEALAYGMPPTGGLGVGIDRLVMLLTGQSSIRDALLFPQMRPLE